MMDEHPIQGLVIILLVASCYRIHVKLQLDGLKCYFTFYTSFCYMKRLEAVLLLLDKMLVHHRMPSMKGLGVLLLPPGWDASPSQDTQHEGTWSITTPPWMGC